MQTDIATLELIKSPARSRNRKKYAHESQWLFSEKP